MGTVRGDGLQCPYHGSEFNGATGVCSHIPALRDGARIPPKARVGSYPVIERFGHVGTCLGDPVFDLANPPEIADLTLDWRAATPIPARCGFMAALNYRSATKYVVQEIRRAGSGVPAEPVGVRA